MAQDDDVTALTGDEVPHAPGAVSDDHDPFFVDLPQFVTTEAQAPSVRPLQPVKDREPPRGLRARVLAAAKDWRLKGTIQKVLGVAPGGRTIHHHLQRGIGGLRHFAAECDTKVDDWRLMMEHLTPRLSLRHATLYEIGTGWYPTFPVCLYLAGVERIVTVDLDRLLDPALTVRMVERLGQHLPLIARVARRDVVQVRTSHARLWARLREGKSIAAATQSVIEYRAPANATRTGLPPASIDVVFSNSVLEHIPAPQIDECFEEAMRILRPGGMMFHSVNCGDHYAYTDPTINQLHYLTYSDADWRFWNNAFLYQNRLRAEDFTASAREAGFTIALDTSRPHPDRLAQLDRIAVDAQFAHYSRAQLAITSIDFIATKPAADRRGN